MHLTARFSDANLVNKLVSVKSYFLNLEQYVKENAFVQVELALLRDKKITDVAQLSHSFRQNVLAPFINAETQYRKLLSQAINEKLVAEDFENYNQNPGWNNLYHKDTQEVLARLEQEYKSDRLPAINKLTADYEARVGTCFNDRMSGYGIGYTFGTLLFVFGIGVIPLMITAIIHAIDKLITHVKIAKIKNTHADEKQALHNTIVNSDDAVNYHAYGIAKNLNTLFKPLREIAQQMPALQIADESKQDSASVGPGMYSFAGNN